MLPIKKKTQKGHMHIHASTQNKVMDVSLLIYVMRVQLRCLTVKLVKISSVVICITISRHFDSQHLLHVDTEVGEGGHIKTNLVLLISLVDNNSDVTL